MKSNLIELIEQSNPWLNQPNTPITTTDKPYVVRLQQNFLLHREWDKLCTVLVGPRQAGKSTLGLHLCQQLIQDQQRFDSLLYLNCDLLDIRNWLSSPLFYKQAQQQFDLKKPIVFIDEIQRLPNPGLLLKALIDLQLPIKLMASGSSQLELKSKVQEPMTGRQLESIIYPLSWHEDGYTNDKLIYGCYPAVTQSKHKAVILEQLYNNYINKDIIEILKVSKPDTMQNLIGLIAHSSGQLVNYNQLANDCKVAVPTIHNYLHILEASYVIKKVTPFTGNMRKEIVSNPVYYFIDNGFRNQALKDFKDPDERMDAGLLVESAIFQELLKSKVQLQLPYDIHFWRTQSGAEIDFVLEHSEAGLIPIEVKYRNLSKPSLTRAMHSFIDAYAPKQAFVITKNHNDQRLVKDTNVYFIALAQWKNLFKHITKVSPL